MHASYWDNALVAADCIWFIVTFMYEMHNAANGRVLCVVCNLQSPKWLSICLIQETAFPPLSRYQFGSVGPLTCREGRTGPNDKVISSRVSLFWNIFAFHQGSYCLRWLLIKWQKRYKLSGSLQCVPSTMNMIQRLPFGFDELFGAFARLKYSQAN